MLRVDQRRHHAAERLDAERQRRHVEQQQVLDLAGQHAGLDRGADGDDFVGIDALVRLLAEQLLDDLLHPRDARRAADEHDLVDLARVDAGVGERLLASGPTVRCSRSSTSCSNFARVSFICRCFGPL